MFTKSIYFNAKLAVISSKIMDFRFQLDQKSHENHKDGELVTGTLRSLAAPLTVVYISSYIPRKCGIATFTKYLTNSINQLNPLKTAKIIALNDPPSESISYPEEVVLKIRDNDISEYKKAARLINRSRKVEIVSLQHEFGLYGDNQGEKVVDFIRLVKKPVISTIHSLRTDYDEIRKDILREIYDRSAFNVVMLDVVREKFASVIGKNADKVVAIPHGVLDFSMLDERIYKNKLRLKGKIVMSSINLLSEWKGIEYAIRAIPKIVREIPNFVYLVIGETHPTYISEYGGDIYRKKLKKLVKKLNVENNVRFINRYVSVSEQKAYIGASDFYITPYLDSQQASSGSLAFAIGAGKVCISTPYLYAREMLARGKGMLVPFRSSKSIANAVISAIYSPEKMKWYQKQAYEKGRLMTWVNVAHQYFHLFHLAKNGH
jgi:polysaccharide biosynthesis protein PslF